MAMTCTVCQHESRVVIDRLIGTGTATVRDIAAQFELSPAAIQRHKTHVVATVRRTIERKRVEREEQTTSVWKERLEEAYAQGQRGMERAALDPKQWPAGARFLAVVSKLIETGLAVDGVIGPNQPTTTTTDVVQVLVLPMKPRDLQSVTDSIESTCESADEGS